MNPQQLQQQIALYYSKLPSDVQVVFSSMKWMDNLGDISKKYGLTEEQIQTLGTETTLVMLGMVDMEEYEKNIQNEIPLPTESLLKMITEINTTVLGTIRPQLTNTYQKNAITLAEEKYGGVEKLDERFLKLPKEVQNAISESNYQRALYAIAEKHKLSINQMGALEEATTKVMLSIIHPDKYEVELQTNIEKPKEEIAEIASEVNESVLKNIREILKSHWGKSTESTNDIDDEVPTPPYAIKSPVIESIVGQPSNQAVEIKSGPESSIYKSAGIEIIDKKESIIPPVTQEKKMPPTENIVLKESGIDMIANKLDQPTVSRNIVSDHSLPKMEGVSPESKQVDPTSVSKAHDPYHEVIE